MMATEKLRSENLHPTVMNTWVCSLPACSNPLSRKCI